MRLAAGIRKEEEGGEGKNGGGNYYDDLAQWPGPAWYAARLACTHSSLLSVSDEYRPNGYSDGML